MCPRVLVWLGNSRQEAGPCCPSGLHQNPVPRKGFPLLCWWRGVPPPVWHLRVLGFQSEPPRQRFPAGRLASWLFVAGNCARITFFKVIQPRSFLATVCVLPAPRAMGSAESHRPAQTTGCVPPAHLWPGDVGPLSAAPACGLPLVFASEGGSVAASGSDSLGFPCKPQPGPSWKRPL